MDTQKKIFLKSCRYNVRNYALSYSLMMSFYGMIWVGLSAVTSSIEKRYSLSSSQSGFIYSAAEIGRIPCLLIVSHFGNRVSTPRLVTISGLLVSASTFIIALPHFIFEPDVSTSTSAVLSNEFCVTSNTSLTYNPSGNVTTIPSANNNFKAYAVIIIGMFFMGVFVSPLSNIALSYIDNNAVEGKSPVYMGFVEAAWSIAPIISSFLASYYMSLYVDLSGTSFTQDDAGWVGAWWLMILSVTVTVLLTAPWIACYPKDTGTNPLTAKVSVTRRVSTAGAGIVKKISLQVPLKNSFEVTEECKPKTEYIDTDEEQYTIKGLFSSLIRIFKNPLLLCLVVFGISRDAAAWGYRTYLPKYMETQFGTTASRASLLSGLGGVPQIVAALTISAVYTKVNLSFLMTIKCMIGAFALVVAANVGMVFVGCPSPVLASTVLNGGKELSPSSCNIECGCSTKLHIPYCDIKNDLTYFSPCYAGCSASVGSLVMGNCTCVSNTDLQRGICRHCDSYKFPLFITLYYIDSYFLKLTLSPFLNLCMRCVRVGDKSLALGVVILIIACLAWLPMTIYYGKVIDLTCSVWQMVDGNQGSCWMYSFEKFRTYYFGLNIALDVTGLVFLVIALIIAKKKKMKWSSELEEKKRRESKMSASLIMEKLDGDDT